MSNTAQNPFTSGSRPQPRSGGGDWNPQENLYGTVIQIIPGDGEISDNLFSNSADGLAENRIPHALVRLETPFYNKAGEVIVPAGETVAIITPPGNSENNRLVSNMMRPVDNQAYIGPNSVIQMGRTQLRNPRKGEDGQPPVMIVHRLLNALSEDRFIQPQLGQENEYFNPATRDSVPCFPKALFSSGVISVKRAYHPSRDGAKEDYLQQSVVMLENDRAIVVSADPIADEERALLPALGQDEQMPSITHRLAGILDGIIAEVNILGTPGINVILFRNPDENGTIDAVNLDNRMSLTVAAWNKKDADTQEFRAPTGLEVIDSWRENQANAEILEQIESGEWTVVAMPAILSNVGGSLRVDSEKNAKGNDLSLGCMIFDPDERKYSEAYGFVPAAAQFGVYTRVYNADGSAYEATEVDSQGQELRRGQGGRLEPTGALPPNTHVQMARHALFGVMQRSGSVYDSLEFHEKMGIEFQKWYQINPSAPITAQAEQLKKIRDDLVKGGAYLQPVGGANMARYNEDITLPAHVVANEVVGAYTPTIQEYVKYAEGCYAAAIAEAKTTYPQFEEPGREAAPRQTRSTSRSPSP